MRTQNIMKTKFTTQRFISGLLLILSVTSLITLLLQLKTPGINGDGLARVFQSGGTITDAYEMFSRGAFSRAAHGPWFLLASLSGITLLSWLSFCLARQPELK